MAKSVNSIVSKFTSVIKELEDHAAKQQSKQELLNKIHQVVQRIRLFIEDLAGKFYAEEHKAKEQAARLRKVLLGE